MVAMASLLGLGALVADEARAQLVVAPAPVYEAVTPVRYKVRYGPRRVVVKERVGRPYLVAPAPVVAAVPIVAETRVVQPAPVAVTRVVQPAPVVQTRVIRPAPIVERRLIQPAPVVETRVIQSDPVIQTQYVPYP
jgi:hypothetical protein